ncbi:DUF4908 domain-containing protein [Brevundimonas nasdae]|jgi:Domain of unknown function (DUF4908)|uniref:DUF4908 domain-containing protein n=2 Tax=Brevundimonas nasdae TaxID=172043 RepID=A0ABX8TDF8_9CAUL|nr:DUF4908 domain-containing protein [Brevundimonas nasdae]MBK6023643.1 DUF4908 domain-containing protein [Brevundimonas nasdae]QYC09216.1 DUF4908 domain-containing protein [Brevundimonas nasdae]QYC15265.1 DUF4908 domain-containing protein [Brevundimonas nasdae]
MKLTATVTAKKSPGLTAMGLTAIVALLTLALTIYACDAAAQTRRSTPESGRYVSGAGQAFVLDSSGPRPLLRFERSAEVWVLRPTAAPRGDIIYRNDNGDQILRVTSDGGITLYSTRTPQGSPVSLAGEATRLETPDLGPIQLFNLMARRSGLVSEALGRLIQIDLAGSQSEALCVEALIVTTDAVIRVARSPSTREQVSRLRKITIAEGDRASVTYMRGELRVIVDPARGVSGRPSSALVIRALMPS